MKPNKIFLLLFLLGSTTSTVVAAAAPKEEHLRHPTTTTATTTGHHHRHAQAITVTASSTHYGFDTSTARDSCSTLHTCLDCVAAGCSWTQSLLHGNSGGNGGSATATNTSSVSRENAGNAAASATAPFESAAASVNKLAVSQCVVLCDGVGTDASCFRLGNYQGLNSDEVCHISEQLGDMTAVEEEDQEELPKEAVAAPQQAPMQNLEVTNIQISSTSRQEPSQGPTPMPAPVEDVPTNMPTVISIGDDFVVTSSTETSEIETETTVPTPMPCVGFISCQKCQNNTQHPLACAFVASDSCQSVCPELAHVPCYEADGNYTTMTQEVVCAAAAAKDTIGQVEQDPSFLEGVGFGDDMPQISTSALRSNGRMTFGIGSWALSTGSLLMGLTVGILCFS